MRMQQSEAGTGGVRAAPRETWLLSTALTEHCAQAEGGTNSRISGHCIVVFGLSQLKAPRSKSPVAPENAGRSSSFQAEAEHPKCELANLTASTPKRSGSPQRISREPHTWYPKAAS